VPFLDRALPASLSAASEESERPGRLVGSLARGSTLLAGEPVERMDLNEGHIRAELAEFLARTSTDGGVVLGRGGVVVLVDEFRVDAPPSAPQAPFGLRRPMR
jgi:hypothetical protein